MIAKNDVSNLLMNRQLSIQMGDCLPAGISVRQDRRIREQFRCDLATLFRDDCFFYPADTGQFFLQCFRRNVLAVGKDDQVLLTSTIMKESFLIDLSQISGMKPAVIKSL